MKRRLIKLAILILIIVISLFTIYMINYVNHKVYSNDDFNIETYKSLVDKDNDGIDDQTDIYQSVLNYIATKPKYKSKYYSSGYPDDGYGVCTDVVVWGLKGSGYDLMELVNLDIQANLEQYHISNIDKNIDFRRVTNLKVYFENTAIKLTTDIYDIDKWQAGDIIIFNKHIGIVSDKRNKKGITYIIHHASYMQHNYEEDILEKRNDIVGHYRIS